MGSGMRRWGPALATVLCGALLGVGGSAFAGPNAAGSTKSVRPDAGSSTYRLKVAAVAYHLPGRTALGVRVKKGVVAVDPTLIPLGSRLHVPGYGPGLAADVGTAIQGRIIDLWFPSTRAARSWGRRTVTITIYR